MSENCNEELSIKIIGKLSILLPTLQIDLQKQLHIKRELDEIIYNYKRYKRKNQSIYFL